MAESEKTNFEVGGKTLIEYGDICEMCEITASVGYCSRCRCYICQVCFDNHVRVKTNHHHVLRVTSESNEDDLTVHFKTCTEHTQQEVRLYCTDHKCFGCGECMLFHHKSCKYKYITEASKEFDESGDLARFLENIQDLENIYKNCVESISSQSELSDNMFETTLNDVRQFVKDVVSYATDEGNRILKNAGSKKSLNDDKIEKLSDGLRRIGSDITTIRSNVRSEDKIHMLFIQAVDVKPKLSQIRDTLESIHCQEVIDRYTFHPSRLIQILFKEKRPLCNLSDNTQFERDDEEDYESSNEREGMEIKELKRQLSTQEKRHTFQIQKLQANIDELMTKNGFIFGCGHVCDVNQMSKKRTIKCPTCEIIFGDQPTGTLSIDEHASFVELKFKFDKGIQSKLCLNPGVPYEGGEVMGYADNSGDGRLILNMLKLAFDRKLLFTINKSGRIVTNGIDIFTEKPSFILRWRGYSTKVKEQLRVKGITEADVPK